MFFLNVLNVFLNVLNVYEDQHFLRPEDARFEPGKSLSCYQLFILFMRKLSCLDYSKQDEKSP